MPARLLRAGQKHCPLQFNSSARCDPQQPQNFHRGEVDQDTFHRLQPECNQAKFGQAIGFNPQPVLHQGVDKLYSSQIILFPIALLIKNIKQSRTDIDHFSHQRVRREIIVRLRSSTRQYSSVFLLYFLQSEQGESIAKQDAVKVRGLV